MSYSNTIIQPNYYLENMDIRLAAQDSNLTCLAFRCAYCFGRFFTCLFSKFASLLLRCQTISGEFSLFFVSIPVLVQCFQAVFAIIFWDFYFPILLIYIYWLFSLVTRYWFLEWSFIDNCFNNSWDCFVWFLFFSAFAHTTG